jgi:hypothetical protein
VEAGVWMPERVEEVVGTPVEQEGENAAGEQYEGHQDAWGIWDHGLNPIY